MTPIGWARMPALKECCCGLAPTYIQDIRLEDKTMLYGVACLACKRYIYTTGEDIEAAFRDAAAKWNKENTQ